MDFEQAIISLRNRWSFVVFPVLASSAAVLIVLVIDLLATSRYRATARFLITPVALEDLGDVVDSTEALDNPTITANYAEVFNSPSLQHNAASRLGIEVFEDYELSSVILPETSMVHLTVTGPDPIYVANLANILGEEVTAYMEPFALVYELRSLDPAIVPEAPYSPRVLPDLAVGLVAGAIAGLALAIGLSYLPSLASLSDSQPMQSQDAIESHPKRGVVARRSAVTERNAPEATKDTDKH